MTTIEERAKKIKLLAFDVDGVMTDGSIFLSEKGEEIKRFNVKDGQGLVRIQKSGFIVAIITARENGTVTHRFENLHVKEIHQGKKYKLPVLDEILEKYNLTYEQTSYMGDDLPDICILEKVGLASCPNDAVDEVKEVCHFISTKDGGRGAVRELTDLILKTQGIEREYIVSEQDK
ncbi:HAD hydrolase family protein [bacterium]|nr:HAD hydrolase family protein [bacterium]